MWAHILQPMLKCDLVQSTHAFLTFFDEKFFMHMIVIVTVENWEFYFSPEYEALLHLAVITFSNFMQNTSGYYRHKARMWFITCCREVSSGSFFGARIKKNYFMTARAWNFLFVIGTRAQSRAIFSSSKNSSYCNHFVYLLRLVFVSLIKL